MRIEALPKPYASPFEPFGRKSLSGLIFPGPEICDFRTRNVPAWLEFLAGAFFRGKNEP